MNPELHSLWLKSFRPPFRYLFVFAHMRSGSSLLAHLLNSNPEIIGYGETKTVYDSEASFDRLLSKVSTFFEKRRLNEKYVMDKIVQDELFIETNLLKRADVSCIFLVRNAERSIPSITSMYAEIFPQLLENFKGGENEALEYYQKRLHKMQQLASMIPPSRIPIVLTYDELLNKTESVFALLHRELSLEHAFSNEYIIHKATGMPVIGDYSEAILSGKIQTNLEAVGQSVSPHLLELGKQAYEESLSKLRELCLSA
ncbi:MAG: hypothetical protein IT342_02280 [Candidatus Melainabacteria bacterium]|nr:hypothetical protein [Candidatus Melainabacteria bacterium]